MKIALIGPAFPYRGGIAHHTTMLARYLRAAGHQVDVITFKRQYPGFLFPGKSQEEPDSSGGAVAEGDGPAPERMIDSINPFNWFAVGRRLRARKYDLVAFKFWLPFFGPAFGTIARRIHHKGLKDVMVIIDNLIPHEKRPGDGLFTRYLFRYCNFAITQSSTVAKQLSEHYPGIPTVMLPHPTYENFGERMDTALVRQQLGITSPRVLLFFGFVREYKGLDLLLKAMPEIVRRVPDVHLLVVGEFYDDPAPYMALIADSGVADHITVHNQYVGNEDVAQWFSAADVLVLPYRHATNSGIVQIAYNFATPPIVTDVGSLGEVVLDGRTGYVLPNAEPDTIAAAVEKAFQGDTIVRFAEAIVQERARYTWDRFAEGMVALAKG